MSDITMPRLSDSMEQGTLLTWLKADGDQIRVGDELVEIETDKATMTYQSPAAGILEILATEGESVAIDTPIARVGASAGGQTAPAATAPAAQTARSAVEPEEPTVTVPEAGVSALATAPPAAPGDAQIATSAGGTPMLVRATPLARRVAAEHRVDLSAVTATGPRGRVTRSDVLGSIGLDVPSPTPPPPAGGVAPAPLLPSLAPAQPASPSAGDPSDSIQKLTRVQEVIARRMAQTKATVPDFQVQTEVAVDAVLQLRSQLRAALDTAPSVNDFIVKAAALALREFPLVNGSFANDGFEFHPRINVGVAVATDGALIVPTVTDADTRSLRSIAAEVRRLAVAVRDGTVTPPDLSGATFTVSNLGMYGMTAITPIINAPQAAILGVGVARPVLVRIDGEIVERQLMTLTLSCDHRILYGAEASQFLSRVRELLEEPLLLAC